MTRRQLITALLCGVFSPALIYIDKAKSDVINETLPPRDNWGLTPLGPNVPKPQWKPVPIKMPLKSTFLASPVSGEPLTFVKERQALAALILPVRANSSERQAAELLQRVFATISGATLPIINEGNLQQGNNNDYLISIGATDLAKSAHVNTDNLKPDGYRLQTQGKVLFLVGHDKAPLLDKAGKPIQSGGTGPTHYIQATGTRNGAYGLLERHFGCRWLWPSEAGGEVLPSQETLTLPPLDESDEPAIAKRGIRNYYPENGINAYGRRQQQMVLPMLHRSYADFVQKSKNSGAWFDAMKLGTSVELNMGHSYDDYWNKYGAIHPEFFALQADGTRNQVKLGAQYAALAHLDVSNPELTKFIAQQVIEKFDTDPNLSAASIAPNDGSYPSFCLCEICRRLDPPNGDPVTFSINDKNGHSSVIHYVSLTDRYILFYNQIADAVAQRHPDRLLGALAYSVYSSPPLYAKLSSNIFISYVGLSYFNDTQREKDLHSWDAWAQSASKLLLRPNALLGAYGFPAVYAHKIGADIKHAYQTGMIGTDFDALQHDWASRGLNYYILAKLLWDPSQDIDALIKDYCDKGFGSASSDIQKYFSTLEKLTNQVAQGVADDSRVEDGIAPGTADSTLLRLRKTYTPEKLAELQAILDGAKKHTANDTDVLQRIIFLEQGVRYANAETAWLRAYFAPASPDKTQKVQEALDRRLQVIADLYDHHFYAQDFVAPLYREAGLAKKYGWTPK